MGGDYGSSVWASRRFAGLVRNQLVKLEREGLRKGLFGRGYNFKRKDHVVNGSQSSTSSGIVGGGGGGDGGDGSWIGNGTKALMGWARLVWVDDVDDDDEKGRSVKILNGDHPPPNGIAIQDGEELEGGERMMEDDDEDEDTHLHGHPKRERSKSITGRGGYIHRSMSTFISFAERSRKSLAISRPAFIVVALLLILGTYEMIINSRFVVGRYGGEEGGGVGWSGVPWRITVKNRDPFEVLRDLGVGDFPSDWAVATWLARASGSGKGKWRRKARWSSSSSSSSLNKKFLSSSSAALVGGNMGAGMDRDMAKGDTAAILLNWKRLDNLVVIVTHLCRFAFFDRIVVWNNNPDVFLTREVGQPSHSCVCASQLTLVYVQRFASSQCPPHRLHIHNSPRNGLFLSRFLACSVAGTPYCYFQDDDWIVKGIEGMYAEFKRGVDSVGTGPAGRDGKGSVGGKVVVSTTSEVAILETWEWCFFSEFIGDRFNGPGVELN